MEIEGADCPQPYKGSRRILMITADELCLPTDTGKLFCTGNHLIETLLPMYHLHTAWLQFDVASRPTAVLHGNRGNVLEISALINR